MSTTVAIVQSNYLPWRGYFELIRRCEVFVLYDVVQYTRRDWRNRNIIKTRSGPQWLTVPVRSEGAESMAIDEATVVDPRWAAKHIETLRHNYCRAKEFAETSPWLFDLLRTIADEPYLSDINAKLIAAIASRCGISTKIVSCTSLVPREALLSLDRDRRLLAICEAAGASCYLTGPVAKAYLDESSFRARGIDVAWMRYDGFPDYPQLWGRFESRVSIVDLLLNTGASASKYFPPLLKEDKGDGIGCGSVQPLNSRDGGCATAASGLEGT